MTRFESSLQTSRLCDPRLGLRAVVGYEEGVVLLVREKKGGLWILPRGWGDLGGSPGEARRGR